MNDRGEIQPSILNQLEDLEAARIVLEVLRRPDDAPAAGTLRRMVKPPDPRRRAIYSTRPGRLYDIFRDE